MYNKGCRLITHLYSVALTITRVGVYRRLGVTECAYLLYEMKAEIIVDGSHLHPELLILIIKLKGTDKVSLITDAMRTAGMSDGDMYLSAG